MPAMSAEEVKAAARRYADELYNKGNTAIVDEFVAPEVVYHTAKPPVTPDREGVIQEAKLVRAAFPDLRFTVDDLLLEGDKGVMHWTMRGTHDGEFLGVPPTHKRVAWSGVATSRMRDGKIVEMWNYPDTLDLLRQIGALPQFTIGQQPEAPQAQA